VAKRFNNRLDHPGNLVCLGYVDCHLKGFAIMGLYGPGDIVEWFGSNIRECHMGALASETAGDSLANATRCACNQGYFSVEFHWAT
jgi:hypothetical protein